MIIYDSESAGALVGCTITGVVEDASEDSSEGFYGFMVKKGKVESVVWVLRDPEGNGPGCLDAPDLPE